MRNRPGRGALFSSWAPVPGALALALGGQALLMAGWIGAGAVLYVGASSLLLARREEGDPAPTRDLPRNRAILALAAVLGAAFLLRRWEIGSIPWGLNNDEGIEGLIACRFLEGGRITPFSSIGLSRETLYHVLLVPLFRLLGPGLPALRLLSLLSALATLPVLYWTGKELFSARVGIFSAALMAVSPWHLLYSRTGLRNILLPCFVLAALGSYQRALGARRLAWFAFTGAALGVGMYSYTSFRVVLPVLAAWTILRRFHLGRPPLTWRECGALILPFLLLMIPQLVYAAGSPGEFLTRGGYVLAQTPRASLSANLLYSLLMPVIYPARYGVMQSLYFFGDGVSLVYAAVGRTPETAVSAAVMACGVLLAISRLLRRREEPAGVLLLSFFLTVLTVGLAGPSLTRLIGNLPLLCLAGGLFLEETGRTLRRRFPPAAARGVVLLLLAAAGALCCEQYFLRAGTSRKAMFYYAAPETIMGLYAAGRPPDHPVYLLHSEEPETLQFLTYPRRKWVTLETDPARMDLERIGAAGIHQEFVIENSPRFLPFLRSLGAIFPDAEIGFLSDARHGSGGRIATILNAEPPHGRIVPGDSPPAPGGTVRPAPRPSSP